MLVKYCRNAYQNCAEFVIQRAANEFRLKGVHAKSAKEIAVTENCQVSTMKSFKFQTFAKCLELLSACIKIQRWYRHYKFKNSVDPITQDPFTNADPFFVLVSECNGVYSRHRFDPLVLSDYFRSSVTFENPLTRVPLNVIEVKRLERLVKLVQKKANKIAAAKSKNNNTLCSITEAPKPKPDAPREKLSSLFRNAKYIKQERKEQENLEHARAFAQSMNVHNNFGDLGGLNGLVDLNGVENINDILDFSFPFQSLPRIPSHLFSRINRSRLASRQSQRSRPNQGGQPSAQDNFSFVSFQFEPMTQLSNTPATNPAGAENGMSRFSRLTSQGRVNSLNAFNWFL